MKEAKLSVRNNIANTTEAHARELSWKTQEEGLQQEVAILYRNDPLKLLPRGFLRIIGGGVPPGSPTSDPISDKKCHFSHPFSDLAYKQEPLRNDVIIT